MTQVDRDRLVALRQAAERTITQKQAGEELGLSVRQVKRLVRELKRRGDEAMEILSRDVYRGFGPTLASEYGRSGSG